jgi:hypothetical protein
MWRWICNGYPAEGFQGTRGSASLPLRKRGWMGLRRKAADNGSLLLALCYLCFLLWIPQLLTSNVELRTPNSHLLSPIPHPHRRAFVSRSRALRRPFRSTGPDADARREWRSSRPAVSRGSQKEAKGGGGKGQSGKRQKGSAELRFELVLPIAKKFDAVPHFLRAHPPHQPQQTAHLFTNGVTLLHTDDDTGMTSA